MCIVEQCVDITKHTLHSAIVRMTIGSHWLLVFVVLLTMGTSLVWSDASTHFP